ncbi:MAG: ATP synthase subunit I [Alphaproteobacteria bacterium]
MTAEIFMRAAALASAAALAGLVLGLAYFAALRRTVELLCARRERLLPAALTLGRAAAAVLVLTAAAKLGIVLLCGVSLGFLAARAAALRSARRAV